MSRLMSVAFTEQAVRERRKTVTRRKGWWEDKNGRRLVKPGDHLTLCHKVMGRKKGEPLVRIAEVEVVSVRREPLTDLYGTVPGGPNLYGHKEMEREGFPGEDPWIFVHRYFEQEQGIDEHTVVTRIEWRYLDDQKGER